MKNYFNTILPISIKSTGNENRYLNVLTRTCINGIFVGHPGIINRDQYNRWGNNINNNIGVCFPFVPSPVNHGHNVIYEMIIRDISVVGKSSISDVKTIRSHNLSVDTISRIAKQVTDRPVVFEIIGKTQASKAFESLYKFIDTFKHVRFCNKTSYDYTNKYNHALYIEIHPINLCIPLFDTKNVDGFGIVANIIGNDNSMLRSIAVLVSKYRDNLFVVDGGIVCDETKTFASTKNDLMKTINFSCTRTASIHQDRHWSIKTKPKESNIPTEGSLSVSVEGSNDTKNSKVCKQSRDPKGSFLDKYEIFLDPPTTHSPQRMHKSVKTPCTTSDEVTAFSETFYILSAPKSEEEEIDVFHTPPILGDKESEIVRKENCTNLLTKKRKKAISTYDTPPTYSVYTEEVVTPVDTELSKPKKDWLERGIKEQYSKKSKNTTTTRSEQEAIDTIIIMDRYLNNKNEKEKESFDGYGNDRILIDKKVFKGDSIGYGRKN